MDCRLFSKYCPRAALAAGWLLVAALCLVSPAKAQDALMGPSDWAIDREIICDFLASRNWGESLCDHLERFDILHKQGASQWVFRWREPLWLDLETNRVVVAPETVETRPKPHRKLGALYGLRIPETLVIEVRWTAGGARFDFAHLTEAGLLLYAHLPGLPDGLELSAVSLDTAQSRAHVDLLGFGGRVGLQVNLKWKSGHGAQIDWFQTFTSNLRISLRRLVRRVVYLDSKLSARRSLL